MPIDQRIDLERTRELKAVEDRTSQLSELARLTEEHRMQQRSAARKSEVEQARAALAELERRNADEDAFDHRVAAIYTAEQKAAADHAALTTEQKAVADLRSANPAAPAPQLPTQPAKQVSTSVRDEHGRFGSGGGAKGDQ